MGFRVERVGVKREEEKKGGRKEGGGYMRSVSVWNLEKTSAVMYSEVRAREPENPGVTVAESASKSTCQPGKAGSIN